MEELYNLSGFGNHLQSEAVAGALPIGQNSPQKVAHGLYAELLTGSAFTQERRHNRKLWMYRMRPSVIGGNLQTVSLPTWLSAGQGDHEPTPEQLRWMPMPDNPPATTFVQGLFTMASAGQMGESGGAIHHYSCNRSMGSQYFYNADAEMMLLPQKGELFVATETGTFHLSPQQILLLPRGMKFKVDLSAEGIEAKGYCFENYGEPFALPELGPIGSSGLANTRDFFTAQAAFEENRGPCQLLRKFAGRFWQNELPDSPLDVVAWHGNHLPMKYDLRRFNTIGSISYDHPDPSIFTVLSSPSPVHGKANIDFVIFPPRWLVAENSFRPPYFHRNLMNEYMGLLHGTYDAKEEGFVPGGASLHSCMSPHGPEKNVFDKASSSELAPQYLADTMAFMFEGHHLFYPTTQALNASFRDRQYLACWQSLEKNFKNPR